jgi:hypothetical protein
LTVRHSKTARLTIAAVVATAAALAALMAPTSPAAAAGTFAVVDEVTGVGGAQTAGRLLRLTTNVLVSGPLSFPEPWPTDPGTGLRVRTSSCNDQNDPRDLPIKEARIGGPFTGHDVVVLYPGDVNTGYGTCSYRGLVTLTLTPASQYPGSGTRFKTITIRS